MGDASSSSLFVNGTTLEHVTYFTRSPFDCQMEGTLYPHSFMLDKAGLNITGEARFGNHINLLVDLKS